VAVRSELNPDAVITVVGEGPGVKELEDGRPFVGPSGALLESALRTYGLFRRDVSIVNTISCRFKRPDRDDATAPEKQGSDRERFDAWLLKTNRKRREKGLDNLIHPIINCRARFQKDIADAKALVPMGSTALAAVAPDDGGIQMLRGTVMQVALPGRPDPIPCVPTYHPAFVLRQRRWTGIFWADINRAIRHARGQAPWLAPAMKFTPTPAELREFLKQSPLAFDVETGPRQDWLGLPERMIEPMHCELRCIGVGTGDNTMIVPFRSVEDRDKRFYSVADETEIIQILREWFEDPNRIKVGHNSGSFDTLVIETMFNDVAGSGNEWRTWAAPEWRVAP